MNGPEHYAEAETLLRESRGGIRTPQTAASEATRANTLAAAQVHATLALAAATLETAPGIVTPGWTEAVMGS
jgi:hypothetical protein